MFVFSLRNLNVSECESSCAFSFDFSPWHRRLIFRLVNAYIFGYDFSICSILIPMHSYSSLHFFSFSFFWYLLIPPSIRLSRSVFLLFSLNIIVGRFFSVVVCGFHSSLLWLSVCCFLSKTFEASYTMWCLVSTCLSLTLGFFCECMSFVCYWFRFDIVHRKLCYGKICTQYSCKSMPLHSHDWMVACSDQVK